MTNLLDTGAAWLSEQLQEHASRTVTYARGASTITDLAATRGRTQYEVTTDESITTAYTDADWIIDCALLIIDSALIEPRSGDRIIETIDSVEHTYEVMPLPGLQCFSTDPTGTIYRIHTKHVSP